MRKKHILLVFGLALLFIPLQAEAVKISLGDAGNLEDVRLKDGSSTYAPQLKFNISSIPAGSTITSAILSLYSYDGYTGAFDSDTNISLISEQTWTDYSLDTATASAQTVTAWVDNHTWNATSMDNHYWSVSVLELVMKAYNDGDDNATFRVYDPDNQYVDSSCSQVTDGAELAYGNFGAGTYVKYRSEDLGGSTPVLEIEYTPPAHTCTVELYINGSAANANGKFYQHWNLTAVSDSTVPITLYKDGVMVGNNTDPVSNNITNYTNEDWFYPATWNISAGWKGNSTDLGCSAELSLTATQFTAGGTINAFVNGSSSFSDLNYPAVVNYSWTLASAAYLYSDHMTDVYFGVREEGTNLTTKLGSSGSTGFILQKAYETVNMNLTFYHDGGQNFTDYQVTKNFRIRKGTDFNKPKIFVNDYESENISVINGTDLNLTCFIDGLIYPDNYEPFTLLTNITHYNSTMGDSPTYENVTTLNLSSSEYGLYYANCSFGDDYNYTGDSRYVTLYISDFVLDDYSYNDQVSEGTSQNYYFKVIAPYGVTNFTTAYITWNGTNYTYDTTQNLTAVGGRQVRSFNFTKSIPDIIGGNENISISFYAEYGFWDNTSVNYNSSEYKVEIYTIMLTNCTGSSLSQIPALTFWFYDEVNRSQINESVMDIALDVYKNNTQIINNFSFRFTDNNTYSICIYPAGENYTINAFLEYWHGSDYPERNYWIFNKSITNDTDYVDLYLLNDSYDTFMDIYVQNQAGQGEEDVLIQIQRYYADSDEYILVAEGFSNFDGEAHTVLQLYTTYYKFLLRDVNSNLLRSFDPFLVTSNEVTLPLTEDTYGQWYNWQGDTSYSCSFNNATDVLSCVFSDDSGTSEQFCLGVEEVGLLTNTTVCKLQDNCLTTASGTLTCSLGNTTGKVFKYYLFRYGSENAVLTGFLDFLASDRAVYGLSGVFGAFVLFMLLSFIGTWNPSVSMILGFVSIIFSYMLGFLNVSFGAIVSLGVAVGFVIYYMRT